ncbi:MAG: metal ABC transporter permease, partial [Patescibacteria group bacterium]
IFLVLRRYSLIADTLAHVSLAGVAVGLLLGINPLLTAVGASVISSVAIERLRLSKKIYGETALSIFLSGSLAFAVVLIGLAHGFSVDLFSYLFGSILTVRQTDVYIISALSIIIFVLMIIFYKELVYISFDEEAAVVSGLPVTKFNLLFIILAAITIALSIPVIGILLISALLVLPVVTALQFRRNFKTTLLFAELISLGSVFVGIIASFYLDVSAGGLIVLIMLGIFAVVYFLKKQSASLSNR